MQQPIIHEPVAVFLTIISVLLVAPLLSERFRLPGIVGLILGGLLVGPHGLGLLALNDSIDLLATVGLIYLMFSAGLEIDLAQFDRVRSRAAVFGLLGFAVPQLSGFFIGRFLGMDAPASILLGSVYASHTLVAFPLLNRLGIMENKAVATTVAATVFTDVASLLVLAVVVGSQEGEGTTAAYVLQLVLLMAGFAALVLFGLPRLGKWFFRKVSGRVVEFQFVLVALFVAAVGAELIGMHAIVGAFLAGLAINSTLPKNSIVSGRVLFVGETLFVPIFMIFVGMSIDPVAIVSSRQALLTGVLLTIAVLATKFIAAWLTGRLYTYSRAEVLTMWGLSQAQAAATLATLLVGVEAGVFEQYVFDGAILMVLVTTISSPIIVGKAGAGLEMDGELEGEQEQLLTFERIMVPVANPETQEDLIRLAALLVRNHDGQLLPMHVAKDVDGHIEGLEHQDDLVSDLESLMAELELEGEPMRKIAKSVPEGIRNASIESKASAILMGWYKPTTFRQQVFGTVIDRVVWDVEVPVFVARVSSSVNGLERVYLGLPTNSVARRFTQSAMSVACALAQGLQVPLIVYSAPMYREAVSAYLASHDYEFEIRVEALDGSLVAAIGAEDRPGPESLVLIPSSGSSRRVRRSLGEIPRQLARTIEDSLMVIHFP